MPKVIQTNKNSLYIIYSIMSISILSLLFINNTYADESSNLNYSVTVESALNITTSSNKVSLDLNPLNHDFDSQDLTVSVSTNNETGYKLYVNTENKTTQLMEKDDNSLYIETLADEVSENNFTTNRWGYRIGSGNYLPFEPGILLNSSKTATENNSSTLTFAAKVGYETKAGTYALALNFQVTANPQIYEIQNLDSNLCTEDPMTVIDNRDGQEYRVAKLKDGQCWMLDNLNLGATAITNTLDVSNTNIDDGSSIDAGSWNGYRKTSGTVTYVDPEYIPLTTANTSNGLDADPVSGSKYGTSYNYCAVSAKTVCTNSKSIDASSDICPAGWQMPSKDQFQTLSSKYNNSVEKLHAPVIDGGAALPFSGGAGTSGPGSQGVAGAFQVSTASHSDRSYTFYVRSNSTTSTMENNLRFGMYALRCILK